MVIYIIAYNGIFAMHFLLKATLPHFWYILIRYESSYKYLNAEFSDIVYNDITSIGEKTLKGISN